NIVQVYEFGTSGDQPFFSLEFCSGGSLADHLQGQPQPPAQAAAIVATLAHALHHAHGAGIIHRDLKPSNILLQSLVISHESLGTLQQSNPPAAHPTRPPNDQGLMTNDFLKITDFGLAHQVDAGLTASGAVLGTPAYMAPEQAAGRIAQIGPATDVYA